MKRLILLAFLMVVLVGGAVYADKTHVFKGNDTLWDLAAKNYGDPTLYTILLEVNGITNARTIANGTVIVIPNKSKMVQIANETDPERRKELVKNFGKGGGGSQDTNPSTGNQPSDQVTRTKTKITEADLLFSEVLKGPKVPTKYLLKVEEER
jgi:LysM repeat protein